MDDSAFSSDEQHHVLVRSQKGKVATKGSWADLPHDVLRYVVDAFPRAGPSPFIPLIVIPWFCAAATGKSQISYSRPPSPTGTAIQPQHGATGVHANNPNYGPLSWDCRKLARYGWSA